MLCLIPSKQMSSTLGWFSFLPPQCQKSVSFSLLQYLFLCGCHLFRPSKKQNEKKKVCVFILFTRAIVQVHRNGNWWCPLHTYFTCLSQQSLDPSNTQSPGSLFRHVKFSAVIQIKQSDSPCVWYMYMWVCAQVWACTQRSQVSITCLPWLFSSLVFL